jgi:hypothetical protein
MRRGIAACIAALALVAAEAPAAGADALLVVRGGHVTRVQDPFLPPEPADDPGAAVGRRTRRCGAGERPRARTPRTPVATASSARTIGQAVGRAAQAGKITPQQRAEYLKTLHDARAARGRLSGIRRAELSNVIATMWDLARRDLLTSGRMPALFLTLERNTEYWLANSPPKLPPPGQPCVAGVGYSLPRLAFGDDPVVFQWYPGHGLQIQVLGNFGKANALAENCLKSPPNPKAPCMADKLKALLDRLVALRVTRGTYTTWEYDFPFGGGKAPWVSGMAQATALQALARGSQVLNDPSYLQVARAALGAFQTGPPRGIRVPADGGSHYLIYNFAPRVRVLNGFLQSLIGLYDYATISNDPVGWQLFQAGDRAARVEVPRYDTGAWSLYSLGEGEANLDYHKLVRDFLQRLCDRTHADVYCATAQRFTSYLHQPPHVVFEPRPRAHRKRPAVVGVWISKVSCVKVAVYRGRQLTFVKQFVFPRGKRSFAFVPRSGGDYRLIVDAKDLAGNRSVLRGSLRVH